jgi:hypothetical protein
MILEPDAVTTWLFRMLAAASVLMCFWLWGTVRAEIHADNAPWYRNKALRLSSALFIHGIGAVLLFASPLFQDVEQPVGIALFLLWGALALWLVAKLLIISVVGRLGVCLAVLGTWTVGRIVWEVWTR